MKHFTFLKPLLMALMLVGGVNCAWAVDMTTMTGLLGLTDNSNGFGAYHSKPVTLAAGDSYVYTFINYNKGASGTDEWENWVVEATNGSKYLDFRADGGYWGDLPTAVNYTGSVWSNVSETRTTWLSAYNGVTVTVTVSRSNDGTTFTVAHTATLNTSAIYAGTYTATISASDAITFYLTNEDSHLLITKVIYADKDGGGTIYTMPKMTYVNYSDADHSYGEIAYGETAETGYNNLSGTYPNQTVGFANTGWGVNYITYINVDASDVPDGKNITGATLTFEGSGSSTDSKNRASTFGVGFNSSTWSSSLTYNTADKSITTVGTTYTTTSQKSNIFETVSLNITDAVKNDADKIVNTIIYETAAANSYIKQPEFIVNYSAATLYNVTFTETNSVAATIKIDDTDVTDGTSLVNGNYSFTATAVGYEVYNGNFTVDGTDNNVEFTMTAKTPVTSITVNYKYNDEVVFSEAQSAIAGLYVGDSYEVPFRMYVMNGGTLYKSTKRGSNPWYGEPTTLTANTVVEKVVTPIDLGGGAVAFFEDLDNTTAQNAGIRASYCSAYDNRAYTSAENLPAGTYNFIVYAQNKGRGSSVKIGETTVFTISDVVSGTGSWTENTISNVAVPAAGKLTFVAGNGSTYDDYDIIIAVLKSVPATIGEAGWATLYTPYALDFSEVAGLTAYTATLSGNIVTLNEVDDVPANTGVVLNGTEGSYDIPVITSSSTGKGDLIGNATEATAYDAITGYDLYMLALNGSGDAQFTYVKSGSIAAGKAFLKVAKGGSVKAFSVVVGDITTGVQTVEPTTFNAQPTTIFNLAGQRLNKMQKGINIVNGKKVIK